MKMKTSGANLSALLLSAALLGAVTAPGQNAAYQQSVEQMMEQQHKFMDAQGFGSGGGVGGGAGGGGGASGGGGSAIYGSSPSISSKTVNGSTVIVYQGKEISLGKTDGPVSARALSVNGTNYAAVFEGDRVIWENTPGAAQQLPSGRGIPGARARYEQAVQRMAEQQRKFIEEHQGQSFGTGSGGSSYSGGGSHSGGGSNGGISTGSGPDPSAGAGGSFASGGGNSSSLPTSQATSAGVSTKIVNGSTVIVYQGRETSVGKTQGPISTKTSNIRGKTYAAAFDGDRVIWENVPGAADRLN